MGVKEEWRLKMDGGSRRVEVKEGRRLSAMEVKEGWGLHGDGGKRGMDVKVDGG